MYGPGGERRTEGEENRMFTMALQLFLAAAFHVLVTILVWKLFWSRKKKHSWPARLFVGLIYGGCCILSNHFSINMGDFMVNVRDIAPLAAGLLFHPAAGIIAGIIGGVERAILGFCFHMGEYTVVACSVSTILAGFLPLILYKTLRTERTSTMYGIFLGAVMEVLHMYAVFLTHHNDILTAYELVKVCAFPMICFTALGVGGCVFAVRVMTIGWPWQNFRKGPHAKPLSTHFRFWLLMGTMVMFIINYGISYVLQTRNAIEEAIYRLDDWLSDIVKEYDAGILNMEELRQYIRKELLKDTRTMRGSFLAGGGINKITPSILRSLGNVANMDGIYLLNPDGTVRMGTDDREINLNRLSAVENMPSLQDVLSGRSDGTILLTEDFSELMQYALVHCGDVFLLTRASVFAETEQMPFAEGEAVAFRFETEDNVEYVVYTVIDGESWIMGSSKTVEFGEMPDELEAELKKHYPREAFFTRSYRFPAISMYGTLEEQNSMYVVLFYATSEAFASRDAQIYENTFSDILLFVCIYGIISVLMRRMVVRPLHEVNASLHRITEGNLSETVNVETSEEFKNLSADINTTVDALKGYIDAAEKRMEQELQLAASIQESTLPRNFNFHRTDLELYAIMEPARHVGGDFYDYFFMGQNRLALVIADVSGKGIPAALFMMRSKTAIRNLAESGLSPSEIFSRANNILCDGNDVEMFVTAWIGILNLDTGEMICANAGHEYPVIMRAGGSYAVLRDQHSLALAAMEDAPMKEYTLILNPGDRLFVYTDGVPEAINEAEEQYGMKRLVDVLNRNRDLSQKELLPVVRQDIRDFVGKAEQFDDITMLGFHWFGPMKEPEEGSAADA